MFLKKLKFTIFLENENFFRTPGSLLFSRLPENPNDQRRRRDKVPVPKFKSSANEYRDSVRDNDMNEHFQGFPPQPNVTD